MHNDLAQVPWDNFPKEVLSAPKAAKGPFRWKSKFLYRYRPEGIFRFFFGLILDPPRYICFYSDKRQIHLYRPFFSPWHGLFRKKGGTGAGIRFYFPCFRTVFSTESDSVVFYYSVVNLLRNCLKYVQSSALPAAAEQLFTEPRSRPKSHRIRTNPGV